MKRPPLLFRTRDEFFLLHPDRIAYVCACEHYCEVYFFSGDRLFLPFQISYVAERLNDVCPHDFLRAGRSWIVNLNGVLKINIPRRQVTFSFGNEALLTVQMPAAAIRFLAGCLGDS